MKQEGGWLGGKCLWPPLHLAIRPSWGTQMWRVTSDPLQVKTTVTDQQLLWSPQTPTSHTVQPWFTASVPHSSLGPARTRHFVQKERLQILSRPLEESATVILSPLELQCLRLHFSVSSRPSLGKSCLIFPPFAKQLLGHAK